MTPEEKALVELREEQQAKALAYLKSKGYADRLNRAYHRCGIPSGYVMLILSQRALVDGLTAAVVYTDRVLLMVLRYPTESFDWSVRNTREYQTTEELDNILALFLNAPTAGCWA